MDRTCDDKNEQTPALRYFSRWSIIHDSPSLSPYMDQLTTCRGCSIMGYMFFLASVLAQGAFGFAESSRPCPTQVALQSPTYSAVPSTSSSADSGCGSEAIPGSDLANFGQTVNIRGLVRMPMAKKNRVL